MDIDARKEKREKAQSENLLSIIRKEIFPNVYTFPERNKKDRPDIVLAISEKRIGPRFIMHEWRDAPPSPNDFHTCTIVSRSLCVSVAPMVMTFASLSEK